MGNKEDGYNISDSGNWNVASDYSRLKIMKCLYLSDEYSDIATFGTSSLAEEFENQLDINYLKLKGFDRLINVLVKLIDNSYFAIKSKTGKGKLKKARTRLLRIRAVKPKLFKISKNQINKSEQIVIDEEKYNKILEELLKIKRDINEPLNKAHLIFTDKEEFDAKKYKQKIVDLATQKG